MRWSFYTSVMISILLQEIELVEALCGFQKTIEMLDKRQLLVTSHPTEIIKPGKYSFNQNYGREIFFPGVGKFERGHQFWSAPRQFPAQNFKVKR